MNGLRVGNEQASFPFFILQCFNEHLIECCKGTDFTGENQSLLKNFCFTEDYLTIDYIREEKLPVILVTTAKLGSLNHTLLTIEVLQKREIPIAAIIYNTAISTTDAITAESQRYFRTHLPYPLLTLPPLSHS